MLFCFVCIGLFISGYLPTQEVQADKVQSKVTGTLIAPQSSSSDREKAISHKSEKLPKTGQETSLSFSLLGLCFILVGIGTWYLEKRED